MQDTPVKNNRLSIDTSCWITPRSPSNTLLSPLTANSLPLSPITTTHAGNSPTAIHDIVHAFKLFNHPTRHVHSLLLHSDPSSTIYPVIAVKAERGFYYEDDQWTCYRRNYFQLSAVFDLLPHHSSSTDHGLLINGKLQKVSSFKLGLSAKDFDDGLDVILIQQTAKRDKGPQFIPTPQPCLPGGSLSATFLTNQQDQQVMSQVCFDRMQFKNSTAKMSKVRKNEPRMYVLVVTLYAEMVSGELVALSNVTSMPLTVRGKSAQFYQEMRENGIVPPIIVASSGIKRKKSVDPALPLLNTSGPLNTDPNAPPSATLLLGNTLASFHFNNQVPSTTILNEPSINASEEELNKMKRRAHRLQSCPDINLFGLDAVDLTTSQHQINGTVFPSNGGTLAANSSLFHCLSAIEPGTGHVPFSFDFDFVNLGGGSGASTPPMRIPTTSNAPTSNSLTNNTMSNNTCPDFVVNGCAPSNTLDMMTEQDWIQEALKSISTTSPPTMTPAFSASSLSSPIGSLTPNTGTCYLNPHSYLNYPILSSTSGPMTNHSTTIMNSSQHHHGTNPNLVDAMRLMDTNELMKWVVSE